MTVAVGGLSETDQALVEQLSARDIYGFIRTAIVNRVSILINGGTSSGKTTFLNACLKTVDPHERIITLEDTRAVPTPEKCCPSARIARRSGNGERDDPVLARRPRCACDRIASSSAR